jgi:hypothetical protein
MFFLPVLCIFACESRHDRLRRGTACGFLCKIKAPITEKTGIASCDKIGLNAWVVSVRATGQRISRRSKSRIAPEVAPQRKGYFP